MLSDATGYSGADLDGLVILRGGHSGTTELKTTSGSVLQPGRKPSLFLLIQVPGRVRSQYKHTAPFLGLPLASLSHCHHQVNPPPQQDILQGGTLGPVWIGCWNFVWQEALTNNEEPLHHPYRGALTGPYPCTKWELSAKGTLGPLRPVFLERYLDDA